jgi:hypothetical protein
MSLLTCGLSLGQGGRAPLVRTHWVTTTNFMGFHPIPRSRAYLGASMLVLGASLQIFMLTRRIMALDQWRRDSSHPCRTAPKSDRGRCAIAHLFSEGTLLCGTTYPDLHRQCARAFC